MMDSIFTRRLFAALLLLSAATAVAARSLDVKGSESIEIAQGVASVDATDPERVILRSGFRESYLRVGTSAEVIVEEGAHINFMTFEGKTLTVRHARIDQLQILGKAEVHIHGIYVNGPGMCGSSATGEGISFSPESRIHLYADVLAVNDGVISGIWANGQAFTLGMFLMPRGYPGPCVKVAAMPPQVIVHELAGPSFDCGKAGTAAERAVCSDPTLRKLDKELARAYRQALASSAAEEDLRKTQRRWLAQRDRCRTAKCLRDSYEARRRAIDNSGEMTNQRARAICDQVVARINDGSIGGRFVPFEGKDFADSETPEDIRRTGLNVSGTLTADYKGKKHRFAELTGGGTCRTCSIVDLDADAAAPYPEDDEEQRLRWADWGNCDHFLWEQGEAIVVTGSFWGGHSRGVLVSWFAPDGGKRPLCYLKTSGDPVVKTLSADEPELCRAVAEGNQEAVQWAPSVDISDNQRRGPSSTTGMVTRIDLDQDGEPDLVARLEYDSGAGCGYHHEWLAHAVPDESKSDQGVSMLLRWKEGEVVPAQGGNVGPVRIEDASTLAELLAQAGDGAIPGTEGSASSFKLDVFQFRGKPYVLGRGDDSSAKVYSVWAGQAKTWCTYQLLPIHEIEVFYPIESWKRVAR